MIYTPKIRRPLGARHTVNTMKALQRPLKFRLHRKCKLLPLSFMSQNSKIIANKLWAQRCIRHIANEAKVLTNSSEHYSRFYSSGFSPRSVQGSETFAVEIKSQVSLDQSARQPIAQLQSPAANENAEYMKSSSVSWLRPPPRKQQI